VRSEVGVVDVTLRDGHQSLWATRMPTSMMLPIAERMDTMGFHAIDLMAAVTFDVCVRYLREDPWQRIRLMAARVRRTPLNGWVRSKSLISFDLVADDVIELWVQRLAANGLRRVTCFDALFDLDNLAPSIRAGKAAGLYTVGALVFSLSPVHTDQLFADKTRGPIHRVNIHQCRTVSPYFGGKLLVDNANHGLGDRQVSGSEQHENAIPSPAPKMQLSEL